MIMIDAHIDPFQAWYESPAALKASRAAITAWLELQLRLEEALGLVNHLGFGDATEQPADPERGWVGAIADYGYVRTILDACQRSPFDLATDDQELWRAAGHLPTLDDFDLACAQLAGGILEAIIANADAIMAEIDNRLVYLDAQLTELTTDLARFVPRVMTSEELIDGDGDCEQQQFDQPFAIRDTFEGFGIGFEKLRLLAVTETDEDVGLPAWSTHATISRSDMNKYWEKAAGRDADLRKILRQLESYDYNWLDDEHAPRRYWWRHWFNDANGS